MRVVFFLTTTISDSDTPHLTPTAPEPPTDDVLTIKRIGSLSGTVHHRKHPLELHQPTIVVRAICLQPSTPAKKIQELIACGLLSPHVSAQALLREAREAREARVSARPLGRGSAVGAPVPVCGPSVPGRERNELKLRWGNSYLLSCGMTH